jgi:hypothetical protein
MIGIAVVLLSGVLLATREWKLQRTQAAVAAIAAIILYVASIVFRWSAVAATIVGEGPAAGLGVVESAPIWLPILAIPWARSVVRVGVVCWVLGGAMWAAVKFYEPFDVVFVNGQRVPESPMYVLTMVLSIPLMALGFAAGRFLGFVRARRLTSR